jgi:hypothetical protein
MRVCARAHIHAMGALCCHPRGPSPHPAACGGEVPLISAEAASVREPDTVGDEQLLARSRRGGLRWEPPGRHAPPCVHLDLHSTVIRRRSPQPVGRPVPVDRFVPVNTHRLCYPPTGKRRRSCCCCHARGEERRDRDRYGSAIPQNQTSCSGTRLRAGLGSSFGAHRTVRRRDVRCRQHGRETQPRGRRAQEL